MKTIYREKEDQFERISDASRRAGNQSASCVPCSETGVPTGLVWHVDSSGASRPPHPLHAFRSRLTSIRASISCHPICRSFCVLSCTVSSSIVIPPTSESAPLADDGCVVQSAGRHHRQNHQTGCFQLYDDLIIDEILSLEDEQRRTSGKTQAVSDFHWFLFLCACCGGRLFGFSVLVFGRSFVSFIPMLPPHSLFRVFIRPFSINRLFIRSLSSAFTS